jgi:hypothetical protein
MDWQSFFPKGSRVRIFPRELSPRLFLLSDGYFMRWHGSSFFPAYRFSAKLRKLAFRVFATLFSNQTRITDRDWAFDELIKDVFGDYLGVKPWAILLGGEKETRKYILELRDSGGRVMAYIKYGDTEISKKRIEHECSVLSSLPRGIAPEILNYKYLNGGMAILLSPIRGKQVGVGWGMSDAIIRYIASFPTYDTCDVDKHPWIARILSSEGGADLLEYVHCLSARKWSIVLQHGDLAPWNLVVCKNLDVVAYDWGYATIGGFPGRDLAYYLLQIGALIKGWSPEKTRGRVAEKISMLPGLALRKIEADSIVRLAAYDAYLNSREDMISDNTYLQQWRMAVWKSF